MVVCSYVHITQIDKNRTFVLFKPKNPCMLSFVCWSLAINFQSISLIQKENNSILFTLLSSKFYFVSYKIPCSNTFDFLLLKFEKNFQYEKSNVRRLSRKQCKLFYFDSFSFILKFELEKTVIKLRRKCITTAIKAINS